MGLVREPTTDDLLVVVELGHAFDAPGFSPGEWTPNLTPGDGELLVMGAWVPSEAVFEWETALHDHHILIEFDWMSPEWSARMADYETEPALLALEDLETVRKVLTTITRAARFVDGYMAGMFESGVVHAALKRMARLAEIAG